MILPRASPPEFEKIIGCRRADSMENGHIRIGISGFRNESLQCHGKYNGATRVVRLVEKNYFSAGEGYPVVNEPLLFGWHGHCVEMARRGLRKLLRKRILCSDRRCLFHCVNVLIVWAKGRVRLSSRNEGTVVWHPGWNRCALSRE